MKPIDKLVKEYTAFENMNELLNAKGGYRPSLRSITGLSKNRKKNKVERAELGEIAYEYNKLQAERGDSRIAYEC